MDDQTALYIWAAIELVLIIAVIVFIILFLRKRLKKRKKSAAGKPSGPADEPVKPAEPAKPAGSGLVCPTCGRLCPNTAVFCGYCGTALNTSAPYSGGTVEADGGTATEPVREVKSDAGREPALKGMLSHEGSSGAASEAEQVLKGSLRRPTDSDL